MIAAEVLQKDRVTRQVREEALRTMAPIEIARHLYRENGNDFDADVAKHLHNGFVVARPWCFFMFRAVALEPNDEVLLSGRQIIKAETLKEPRHAWLVDAAVTDNMAELPGLFPFKLPYIAFHRRRDNRMRLYPFDRVTELAGKRGKKK